MSEYIMRHDYMDGEDILTVVSELVRCKDCKHFKSETENTGVCDGGFCHAPVHVAVIDFCSYGERRNDELQENDARCAVSCAE